MRRRMWLLAATVLIVGVTGIVIAQNRRFVSDDSGYESQSSNRRIQSFYSRSGEAGTQTGNVRDETSARSSREPVSQTPSRYMRRPAIDIAVPQVKNYHEQLFGSGRPQANTQPKRQQIPTADTRAPQYRQVGHEEPQRFSGATLSRSAAATSKNRVINAEYSRPTGTRDHGSIVPVSVTDENVTPFGSPAAENTKTPAATIPATAPLATAGSGAQTPSVTIEWVKQSDINVGQECECDLVVRNTGKVSAHQIAVEAFFPTTVRLTGATPKPTEDRGRLTWSFDSLAPGKEKAIRIKLIPSRRGQLATTAHVRFTGAAAGIFDVQEPLLKVATKGPKQVMVGDPASQIITVSNPGTGVATNVKIDAQIPAGLEHPRGERLVMEIGALNPGESRQVRLALAAVTGGKQDVQILVTADAGLRQTASQSVDVIAPSLKVAIDGPGLRYLGRDANYTLAVLNDGQIASNNVRVTQQVPEGFEFVKADKGGKYDRRTRIITWFVGRMDAGQTIRLATQLSPNQLGNFEQTVWATSEHGTKTSGRTVTRVEGTASLVLEIVDLDDPVEIGSETAYEIRVKNEGTKAAQAVSLSCELPNGVKLVSAKGPASHIAENGLVVFKSLGVLSPGKAAIYRVHVRGTTAGNHRFRCRLASDSIQEPLIFEELTKFYTD